MKLLLLYSYNKGYLSSFFFELSEQLVKEGHEVVNFCLKKEADEFSLNGIDLVIKKKGGYLTNYFEIYKIIKRTRPDIILSNFSYVNPALLFGKLFGVKKNLVWFHSLNEQMEASKLDIFLKKQFLKLADLAIANSFLTKAELNTIYKIPQEGIIAIPFWSDIPEQPKNQSDSRYSKDQDVFKIGCPGRLAVHKNQKVVIEAVAKIEQFKHFDCHLYIAGDGDTLTDLKELSYKLDVVENISFLGILSPDDMIVFYKHMDVVVLPSLHEAFGLVFIEAISLGTPVIVSSQFGALSFLDETKETISQITFDPNSVDHLLGKLILYFENKNSPLLDFKKMYNKNFNKKAIFELFNKAVINDL